MIYIVLAGKFRSQSPIDNFAEAWILLRNRVTELLQIQGKDALSQGQLYRIQFGEKGEKFLLFEDAQKVARALGLAKESDNPALEKVISPVDARAIEPKARSLIEQWLALKTLLRGLYEETEWIKVLIKKTADAPLSSTVSKFRATQLTTLLERLKQVRTECERIIK